MERLENPRPGFADHDVVLHLLLGLVSGARRLDAVLPAPPPPAPEEPGTGAELDAEHERRVMLLLGLVSVRHTVMRALEPARAEVESRARPEPAARETEAPSLRSLLR